MSQRDPSQAIKSFPLLCILLCPVATVLAEAPQRVILDFKDISGPLVDKDSWKLTTVMKELLPMEVSDGWVKVQGHGNSMVERSHQAQNEFATLAGDEEKAEFQFGIIYHPNLAKGGTANLSLSMLGANSGITAGVGNGVISVKKGGPWGSSPTLGTMELPTLAEGTEITIRVSMNFMDDKGKISWKNNSAGDAFFREMKEEESFSLDGVGSLASTWNRFAIRSNSGHVKIGRIIPNLAAAEAAGLKP